MSVKMSQRDEALRLLAQMYARWVQRPHLLPVMQAYVEIRDMLYHALDQQQAYKALSRKAEESGAQQGTPWKAYVQARNLVGQVVEAGGSVNVLIVGVTDGVSSLCLPCSQDESGRERPRSFTAEQRRPLLRLEVETARRSGLARCHLCQQPICPTRLVMAVVAGTTAHFSGCSCGTCNRAGRVSLLRLYECNPKTAQVLLPHLRSFAAPSHQQCTQQVITLCLEQGWYLLNKNMFQSIHKRRENHKKT